MHESAGEKVWKGDRLLSQGALLRQCQRVSRVTVRVRERNSEIAGMNRFEDWSTFEKATIKSAVAE